MLWRLQKSGPSLNVTTKLLKIQPQHKMGLANSLGKFWSQVIRKLSLLLNTLYLLHNYTELIKIFSNLNEISPLKKPDYPTIIGPYWFHKIQILLHYPFFPFFQLSSRLLFIINIFNIQYRLHNKSSDIFFELATKYVAVSQDAVRRWILNYFYCLVEAEGIEHPQFLDYDDIESHN